MLDEFCEIYEYLVSRLNNNPGYELRRTERNVNIIKKFFLNSKIKTSDEIWKYLSFQIVLSDKKNSRVYYINLSRILSLNSIKRWEERTSEQMFAAMSLLRQRGLRNPLEKSNGLSEEYIDFLRHKYWNTPRGFILCGEYEGGLYDETKCKQCRYKKACSYENSDI